MARIIYAEHAFRDLEMLTDFLLGSAPLAARTTIDLIQDAILVLERHPLIGQPIDDLRELLISRDWTGYVALYSFEEYLYTVPILAVRHQREAGY